MCLRTVPVGAGHVAHRHAPRVNRLALLYVPAACLVFTSATSPHLQRRIDWLRQQKHVIRVVLGEFECYGQFDLSSYIELGFFYPACLDM